MQKFKVGDIIGFDKCIHFKITQLQPSLSSLFKEQATGYFIKDGPTKIRFRYYGLYGNDHKYFKLISSGYRNQPRSLHDIVKSRTADKKS